MQKNPTNNFNELSITENRKLVLSIVTSGLEAINTEKVIVSSISLSGNILSVKGEEFDLSKFKRVRVVGLGKSSCEAASILEKILGDIITEGIVIDLEKVACKHIETYSGTHPKPSLGNFEVSRKIFKMVENSREEDLLIVIVSGGGSALLSYPESEYLQGARLYDAFLKTNKTITEINTVRKHLSLVKGGGLAKVAYPATIIGLIFSDVPGNHFEDVASGPTYKDKTTINDAQKIIEDNQLGEFDLMETPKEDKYFEKVHNFVLVSNKIAVEAMSEKAKEFGFQAEIISTELYDETDKALEKIFSAEKDNFVILAAGEPRISVAGHSGLGGRNLHLGLEAIKMKIIGEDSVFVSFASDGMDNSDSAGSIVDKNTIEKAKVLGLDVDDYLSRFDSYSFFQKAGDMLKTGPTGSNVSDLMVLLKKK